MKNIEAHSMIKLIPAAFVWLASGALWAGTEGTSSTFFGSNAGAAAISTSGNNTFIGANAGLSTTSAGNPSGTFVGSGAGFSNTTGVLNSFFGVSAGFANTTGARNSFFGVGAGENGTTASDNAFFGELAGGTNTTGAQNSFFGKDAGLTNTIGDNNSFFGKGAGKANTTASDNSFFGYNAGVANTTGAYNSFFGDSAGTANTNGTDNSFFGYLAGSLNTTGDGNSFFGEAAGLLNTTGAANTFVGQFSGNANGAGFANTYLGKNAGANNVGDHNVFLGNGAGYSELTSSNKLIIDNCYSGGNCTLPFIYGEFDNHLLKINGVTHVAANGASKSQMHFSLDNGDYGGFLTSVLPNNFFVSSGARFDSPNWVQLSADGNAVMAGSGGVGYRIFTHTGTAVGNTFNNPVLRLHIDYSGQFGINTAPVAGDEIHTSSGAHLTSGGVWTDASSREYKEHITSLTAEEAMQALAALDPVKYNYKANPREKHVGFIAEDVPELVATPDHKSLSPMDIVAVLTKVVSEQRRSIEVQQHDLEDMRKELEQLRSEIRHSGANR